MPGQAKGDLLLYGESAVGDLRVAYQVTLEGGLRELVRLTGSGDYPPKQGDLVAPQAFKATVTDPPGPGRRRVTLIVTVDEQSGPLVMEIGVLTEEGTAMSAQDLRGLNLPRYLDAAVAAVTREADLDEGRFREPEDSLAAVGEAKRRRAGRKPVSDSTLEQVAALYREALAAGVPTAAYIRERLEELPSIPATRRWIMLARQRGFLPPVGSTDEED